MDKVDLGPQGFGFPMPMALVGADLSSGPNFLAAAWFNRLQFHPPRIMVALGREHATCAGIREHRQFSLCIPGIDQVASTDWCGIVSAHHGVDKGAAFTIFRGALEHAPMIAAFPICLECKLHQTVEVDETELFLADIVGTWTEPRFLDAKGRPDLQKQRPFVLSMPDNAYFSLGEHIADAWSVGRTFKHG